MTSTAYANPSTDAADIGKQFVQSITEQFEFVFQFPVFDLSKAMNQYVEFWQRTADYNRELLTVWSGAFTALSDALQDESDSVITLDRHQFHVVSVEQIHEGDQR